MADALVPILELWQRSFLVMDEVDVLLHPLRSELNFPIGAKVPIDLGAQRWNLPFFLLDCLVATDTESRRQQQQQQQAAAAAASGFAAAGAVKSNEEEKSTFLPTEAAALLTTPAHASATQEDAKAASSSSQGMEVDTNVGGAGSDEKGSKASASANMAVKEAAVKAALQELKEAIADG
jgi:hypothetical protein